MRPLRFLFALGAAFAAQRALRPHMPKLIRTVQGQLPNAASQSPLPRDNARDAFVVPASPSVTTPQEQPDWVDDRDVDSPNPLEPLGPNATAHPR